MAVRFTLADGNGNKVACFDVSGISIENLLSEMVTSTDRGIHRESMQAHLRQMASTC
jgi:hypothetical protein